MRNKIKTKKFGYQRVSAPSKKHVALMKKVRKRVPEFIDTLEGSYGEKLSDGLATKIPNGGLHLSMWGGENSYYITCMGGQNGSLDIMFVGSMCDNPIEHHLYKFRSWRGKRAVALVDRLGEREHRKVWAEKTISDIATRICGEFLNEASHQTIKQVITELEFADAF